MQTPIEVRQVHYCYEFGAPVLQNVSVNFDERTTAIIGQNGSGKTTLIRLLNGLLKPVKGHIFVNGVDTHLAPASRLARYVGLAFQNPDDQIFKRSVLDECLFGPRNIGIGFDDAKQNAERWLASLGLEHVLHDNPYDLSFPQRKRLSIASILAMNTPIVILDEPTIGQDVSDIARLAGVVHQLRSEGKTVIAVVHDMNFVAEHFERVLVMSEGTVVADGTPRDVFELRDMLQRAKVQAPDLVRLANAVGFSLPAVTVESFVETFLRRR